MSLNLEAEVAAAGRRPRLSCSVCAFIEEQPADEQPLWDAQLAKPHQKASHRAITRVLVAHGYTGESESAVSKHRNQRHRRNDT